MGVAMQVTGPPSAFLHYIPYETMAEDDFESDGARFGVRAGAAGMCAGGSNQTAAGCGGTLPGGGCWRLASTATVANSCHRRRGGRTVQSWLDLREWSRRTA